MDQLPAALSAILASALDEIRDELNDLKQSNLALVKKSSVLEAAQLSSRYEVERLQESLKAAHEGIKTLAIASNGQRKAIKQLQDVFVKMGMGVKRQGTEIGVSRVNLAQVKNEVEAVKMLLVASCGRERDGETADSNEETRAEQNDRPDSALSTIEEEDEDADETEFFSFTDSPRRSPRKPLHSSPRKPFMREDTVDSAATFCNTRQSVERRERHALGLLDEAIKMPFDNAIPMKRKDLSLFYEQSNKKARTSTLDSATVPAKSTAPALPPLSLRKKAVEASSVTARKSWRLIDVSPTSKVNHLRDHSGAIDVDENLNKPNDDNDMIIDEDEDLSENIILATNPKFKRLTDTAKQSPAERRGGSPTVSEFGRFADDVFKSFDVDDGVYPLQATRSSEPAPETPAKHSKSKTGARINDEFHNTRAASQPPPTTTSNAQEQTSKAVSQNTGTTAALTKGQGKAQMQSVTRASLLSQFQVRTGAMQKSRDSSQGSQNSQSRSSNGEVAKIVDGAEVMQEQQVSQAHEVPAAKDEGQEENVIFTRAKNGRLRERPRKAAREVYEDWREIEL